LKGTCQLRLSGEKTSNSYTNRRRRGWTGGTLFISLPEGRRGIDKLATEEKILLVARKKKKRKRGRGGGRAGIF